MSSFPPSPPRDHTSKPAQDEPVPHLLLKMLDTIPLNPESPKMSACSDFQGAHLEARSQTASACAVTISWCLAAPSPELAACPLRLARTPGRRAAAWKMTA